MFLFSAFIDCVWKLNGIDDTERRRHTSRTPQNHLDNTDDPIQPPRFSWIRAVWICQEAWTIVIVNTDEWPHNDNNWKTILIIDEHVVRHGRRSHGNDWCETRKWRQQRNEQARRRREGEKEIVDRHTARSQRRTNKDIPKGREREKAPWA